MLSIDFKSDERGTILGKLVLCLEKEMLPFEKNAGPLRNTKIINNRRIIRILECIINENIMCAFVTVTVSPYSRLTF